MPDDTSPRFRFGRAMRMQQAREFHRLRSQGQRLVKGCLIANWRQLPTGAPAKLGVVTSKKIGAAVVRTRARRLMREAYRLHQHDLSGPLALVLVARNSIVGKKLTDVERDFLTVMRQAGVLKTSN